MTEPTLSPATQSSVQGLVRAEHEVEQWTKNLEQALADDVVAGRLTLEDAAKIAKQHEVKAPPKPGDKEEAHETTAEANQAQLDAQTKVAEAEAAKTAPKPPPHQPQPHEPPQAHQPPQPPPKKDNDEKAKAKA